MLSIRNVPRRSRLVLISRLHFVMRVIRKGKEEDERRVMSEGLERGEAPRLMR